MMDDMRLLVSRMTARSHPLWSTPEQSGYAVDHCADGEEGLARAQTVPYDAAVMDVMLPKMDGLSVVQELRNKGVKTRC